MNHLFRAKRATKKKSRNKITVRAVLGEGSQVHLEVVVKPKKYARVIKLPLRKTREERAEVRYHGGEVAQLSSLMRLLVKHDVPLLSVPYPVRNLIRLRGSRIPVFQVDRVDARLWKLLMPFQREGVERAIGLHYGRLLLADEMGLGKSLQALVIALYYRQQWPLLIISPAYLKHNWARECAKWDLREVRIVSGSIPPDRHVPINIISYNLMEKFMAEVEGFKVVIADESHYLKNRKAKRTKASLPMLKAAKRVILCTGTPALSRPAELFTQLSIVEPSTFTSFRQFAERYCDAKNVGWGWDTSGSSNYEELQVINHFCMIRRRKDDVLPQLPPKFRQDLHFALAPCKKKEFDVVFYELKEINRQIHSLAHSEDCRQLVFARKQILSKLYHTTGDVKAAMIPTMLPAILSERPEGKPIILFAHHSAVLDAVEPLLKGDYVRVDGTVALAERSARIERFTSGKVYHALLSIHACGTGLNLTNCNHIVFLELAWNPGDLLQAEDRTHRIGQKADSVLLQYCLVDGTLDGFIWDKLQRKFSTVDKVLNDNNQSGLDSETIEMMDNGDDDDGTNPFERFEYKAPLLEQSAADYLGGIGIQAHAQEFAKVWFPINKVAGIGVSRARFAPLTTLLDRHGTEVSERFVREFFFQEDRVESVYHATNPLHQGTGNYINMHEFTGLLTPLWGVGHRFVVLCDSPEKLPPEKVTMWTGHTACFCVRKE